TINPSTGALAFIAAPNFEAPGSAASSNVYGVVVQVNDNGVSGAATPSLSATQAVTVTVTNVNEAPIITSNGGGDTATVGVTVGATAVTTVAATDPNAGNTLTYSIIGGSESTSFSISAGGALAFKSAAVAGTFHVNVAASDGSLSDTQALTVTVSN